MNQPSIRCIIVKILSGLMIVMGVCFPLSVAAKALQSSDIYDMDIYDLMELEVVTATRSKVKLKDTPSAVYVITEKDIRERGYRTLSDALKDVPGFDFQNTYGLFPDLIHQRGLIGNNQRSLVYIDGILDNNISENAILGGTIRYPLHNVDRIEVVAGPVSALYGANAFNGVINIITKDGRKTSDKEVQTFVGTWMDKDYMGGGASFSLNDSTPSAKNQFAYSIGGYYFNSDGPDFSGVQNLDENGKGYWWSDTYNNSDEETYNVTAKFSFDNLRIEFINWQYLQGDGTFANGTYQIDTDGNGFTGSAWDFKNNTVSIGYLWDIKSNLSLDSEIIVRHTELLSSSHESYPNTPGPDAYINPGDVTTASGYARPDDAYELEERLQWQPSDQISNTFGVETIYYVVPEGYGSYEQYKYRNYAGYFQSMYKMTDIVSMIGGYRFDHNTTYEDSHTYRIGAVANPDNFTIKGLFSTGYRAPTAWELLNETRQRKENQDIEPEKMRSIELGLGYTFSKNGHISLQGYYNVIDDLILEVETDDLNPNPEITHWNQNRNIGKATILGLEFNSDFNLTDRLAVYANYTYSDGEYKDLPESLISSPAAHDGESIPNIAAHKINTGVTYHILQDLTLHLRSNYVYRRKTIQSNPTRNEDRYILFHSNICWENAFFDGLYFQLMVINLLDNDDAFDPGIRTATGEYYPTRHPIEGRNSWLTAGYRF